MHHAYLYMHLSACFPVKFKLHFFEQNSFTSGLGYLPVNEELKATGKFELMDLQVDEAEHSMEMHLPYLAKVFHG